MATLEIDESELATLHAVQREYRVTARVLAICIERLLAGQGDTIEISEKELADAPDLDAWSNKPARQSVSLTVKR